MLWMCALVVYATSLALYLTFVSTPTLEFMREVGVWGGLGASLAVFLVALCLPPALLKFKFRKIPFGKACLAWSVLCLGLTLKFGSVGPCFKERGTFVPALIWGPDSKIVKKVAIQKLGWGEDWKLRPDAAGQ